MSEHKFYVGTCCCGCSLRTGTIIIGVLNLIGCLYDLITKFLAATQVPADMAGAFYFAGVVSLLGLLVALVLLIGVHKESGKMVMIWVYVQLAVLALLLIGSIIVIIDLFSIGAVLFLIAFLALNLYFIVVVRSYALDLKSGAAGNNPS